MVFQRSIEANPDRIMAIIEIKSPRIVKEVQSLIGKVVALKKLYLYLEVSNTVISSTLIREEKEVQKPMYYTSQPFQGAETNYPRVEKIT